jgi:hypothetical protein
MTDLLPSETGMLKIGTPCIVDTINLKHRRQLRMAIAFPSSWASMIYIRVAHYSVPVMGKSSWRRIAGLVGPLGYFGVFCQKALGREVVGVLPVR